MRELGVIFWIMYYNLLSLKMYGVLSKSCQFQLGVLIEEGSERRTLLQISKTYPGALNAMSPIACHEKSRHSSLLWWA